MTDHNLIEPDVRFVKEVVGLGGSTLKKCFQCATCSVACAISPDNQPFPRKEMIAASWGLKDRLVGNLDVWLCHNCGDCTTLCPRGARPGDVMAAIRSYAITEYAVPKKVAQAVNDPRKLPFLLAVPVLIFLVLGLVTGLLDFTPEGDKIVHAKFFSTWLVDLIFVPLSMWAVVVFALGLKRFVKDMHESALREGKTTVRTFDPKGLAQAALRVVPNILKHDQFSQCTENRDRASWHMMVFFGFIGLFIVTSIFFVAIYGLRIHGPYSQLNPVKWLANISGVALVVGSSLMLKSRLRKTDQTSGYKDWYLLGLALGLGTTGLLTEITRLAGWGGLSYFLYFIHLMVVFTLFAYLPFSKLAHLVYRTVAMVYAEYARR